MKKSSLNRKFRRALAASLGAVAFASTSSVINAVDPMLIKQRELVKYFADKDDVVVNYFDLGTENPAQIEVQIALKAGPTGNLQVVAGSKKEITPNLDYEVLIQSGADPANRFKARARRRDNGPAGEVAARHFRLCPDIKGKGKAGSDKTFGGDLSAKTNAWARKCWKKLYTDLDKKIKNIGKAEADRVIRRAEKERIAEENARAERERANSLLSSSGSQPAQTAPINNTATLATSALTAMIPMTTMMNNPTPVQTTTSSMVNTGNAMGTQAGVKTDTTNTNLQINHESHVAADKIKT